MSGPDKTRTAAIFDGSWDVHDVLRSTATLLALGEGIETPAEFQDAGPHSVFMDVYQGFTKFHMREFGTTVRQLATVSSKNHVHSVDNLRSQYRQAYSVDEVLAARMIAWPLTLPMCSPVSDGAAAAIVCSPAALAKLHQSRVVQVRASVLAAGGVLLWAGNSPEYIEVMFAAWFAGAVIVPVNFALHPREVASIAEDCRAKVCFATLEKIGELQEFMSSEKRCTLPMDETALKTLRGEDRGVVDVEFSDVAWIFYTSGTTGRPKGAMLSHQNLLAMTFAFLADVDALSPHDCLFHLAPPQSHAGGLLMLRIS